MFAFIFCSSPPAHACDVHASRRYHLFTLHNVLFINRVHNPTDLLHYHSILIIYFITIVVNKCLCVMCSDFLRNKRYLFYGYLSEVWIFIYPKLLLFEFSQSRKYFLTDFRNRGSSMLFLYVFTDFFVNCASILKICLIGYTLEVAWHIPMRGSPGNRRKT